jgi:hypothetical protein
MLRGSLVYIAMVNATDRNLHNKTQRRQYCHFHANVTVYKLMLQNLLQNFCVQEPAASLCIQTMVSQTDSNIRAVGKLAKYLNCQVSIPSDANLCWVS